MKGALIPAAVIVLTGCAASAERNAAVSAAGQEAAVAAASSAPSEVREVTIESFAGVAQCRRQAATGTRIAAERCETKEPETAASRAQHELLRQDVEAMRRQQTMREQQRQAAEAARRRGY